MRKPLLKIIKTMFGSRRRTVISLTCITMVGFLIFLNIRNQPAVNKTYEVKKQTFSETITASGTIKAKKEATLSFIAPAKVTWVGVKKGDTVFTWQGLASVDQRTLQKGMQQKLLDYMTARWNFEQAQDDKDINGRFLNQVTLTDAEKRILEKSQFGLNRSVLDVEIADLAVKEAVLVTPVSGTVVSNDLKEGVNLTGAEKIRIVDLTSLYFEARADELDYAKIQKGQKAVVTLDAFPSVEFPGVIEYVGQEGVKTTGGSLNILVDINLDKYSQNLVSGLNGEAAVIILEKQDVISIPKEFVTYKSGKAYVTINEKGKLIEKEISVGATSGDYVEVTNVLVAGDRVVVVK